MDLFPDPFKPLSDKNAADLANEYWVFNEVTKDDSEPDDFEDAWSNDLDKELGASRDAEPEGEFAFGAASDVPPVEPVASDSGKSFGCGWIFLVLVVLALFGLAIDSCGDSTSTYHEYLSTTMTGSRFTSIQSTTSYTYTTESRYTTRYSASRTKEDFYGVDDYVDAADFADEMQDEFDDWEDAYDYYEEYAE